jgi:flagellar M-ring protein FliF
MAQGLQSFQTLQALPVLRQVGLLVALAGSVALGVYVALWSKTPDFVPLFAEYADMSQSTRSDAISILQLHNVPFQIDLHSGVLLVDSSRLYEARMQLSRDGIALHDSEGFELLDREGGFGESQFIEQTKYMRALQGELGKTITSIKLVRKARVHLAIPKSSPFMRGQKNATASVFLELQGNKHLDHGQVQGIVNLVASSVPGMNHQDVTVVDQHGHLLSAPGHDPFTIAGRHLEYKRSLEDVYSRRVEQLLSPLLGPGRVHAETSALMDFTEREETEERFDPDSAVLRKEQTSDERKSNTGSSAIGGVAGSLRSGGDKEGGEGDQRAQATRSYEINKHIHYTRDPIGRLKRLSVAVLVDDKQEFADDGKITKVPLTKEEIAKLTALVKDAVGFDEKRGDVVSILNSTFAGSPPLPAEQPVPVYEKPWFNQAIKAGLGALVMLLLLFMVLRPAFKQLIAMPVRIHAEPVAHEPIPTDQDQRQLGTMIDNDPQRVAQVMMDWIGNDGK